MNEDLHPLTQLLLFLVPLAIGCGIMALILLLAGCEPVQARASGPCVVSVTPLQSSPSWQ